MMDRAKRHLEVIARAVFPRFDYHALYPGTVVAQTGNLFDVIPDRQNLLGPGAIQLPINHGIPGIVVTIDPTSRPRCLIGFKNGDPSQPYIVTWEPGATVIELDLNAVTIKLNNGNAGVARIGDACSFSLTAPSGGGPVTGTIQISAGSASVKA